MKQFSLFLLIALFITSFASAQTAVSPGDGTLSTAIAAATDGDVLELSAGVYSESTDSVLVIDKTLTIKAADGLEEKPQLQMNITKDLGYQTNFFVVNDGVSFVLDGVEMWGMSDDTTTYTTVSSFIRPAASANVGTVEILNCYIHHGNGYIYEADDGEDSATENIVFDNTVATDVEGGIHFKNADLTGKVTATYSTFANLEDRWLRAQSGDAEGYVDHCTIHNVAGKRLIMGKGNDKIWVIKNSIFSTFTGSSADDCIRPGSNAENSFTYSIVFSDVGLHKDWVIVSDTSSADPMFADPDNYDFTLDSASPALTMSEDGGPIGDPRWFPEATSVKAEPGVVESYKLAQNYPNPFNPTTTITFAVPEAGYTTLKVYNLIGQEVASLLSNSLNAGSYSVSFDAANLPSGVYFYRLTSGSFTQIKKMILAK